MSDTDRNGDPLAGDVLDIIDRDNSRYKVALGVAQFIRDDRNQLLDELLAEMPLHISDEIAGMPYAERCKLRGRNDTIREVRAIIEKKREGLK